MKKYNFIRKVFIVFILITIICNVFVINSFATSDSSASDSITSGASASVLSTYSPSCLLMDATSGSVLYSKNANTKMYPASTTKIMTAILTLENCSLSDVAVASHNAIFSIPSGYSIANIQEGEELTIEQLLNVLLIPSANDAAIVLAEHIAGSVEAFADMMNAKALELGCKNTHFVNPNGIHDENHYSTAYDLALMGQYAMGFDTFREIVAKTSYSLPQTNKYDKDDRLFVTTNVLLRKNYSSSPTNYYYEYATGAKTGYTDAAKNCIVATATKDDISLIVVVLGAGTTDDGISERALDCKRLFEYGFNNFSMTQIASQNSAATQITVKGATQETENLDLLYSEDIVALLPSDYDVDSLEGTVELSDGISAPIAEGTNLGTITYTIDDVEYSCALVAASTVYKSNFTKTLMELLLLIVFLILFSKFLKFKNRRSKSKNKRKSKQHKTNINNYYPSYRR